MNLYLKEPTIEDMDEIVEMCEEIRTNDKDNLFEGLSNYKNVDKTNYNEFLDKIKIEKEITRIRPDLVNQTTYVLIDENNHIYGGVNIRHELNEKLLNHGGNIGCLIRPSERKKGYAKTMLNLALKECDKLGINKVLVTCRKENIGSAKVIESNGGIFEDERYAEENNNIYRRYWITIK